jgi:hypothetical protein
VRTVIPTISAHAVGTAAAAIDRCSDAAEAARAQVLADPPPAPLPAQRIGSAQRMLMLLEDKHGPTPGVVPIAERIAQDAPRLSGQDLTAAADAAAAEAFLRAMPQLANRASTADYIACCAVAVHRRYITAERGKTMLYTAQLALAAHPSRRPKRKR